MACIPREAEGGDPSGPARLPKRRAGNRPSDLRIRFVSTSCIRALVEHIRDDAEADDRRRSGATRHAHPGTQKSTKTESTSCVSPPTSARLRVRLLGRPSARGKSRGAHAAPPGWGREEGRGGGRGEYHRLQNYPNPGRVGAKLWPPGAPHGRVPRWCFILPARRLLTHAARHGWAMGRADRQPHEHPPGRMCLLCLWASKRSFDVVRGTGPWVL